MFQSRFISFRHKTEKGPLSGFFLDEIQSQLCESTEKTRFLELDTFKEAGSLSYLD